LLTLLTNAGIAGPYVLVGHPLADKNVRLFALQPCLGLGHAAAASQAVVRTLRPSMSAAD
jgi:hypothetical protein